MIQLLRNMLGSDPRLWALVKNQHELIQSLRAESERQQLEYARNVRDLLVNFRGALNEDRDQIDSILENAITDMSDSVARLEEHVR